MGKCRLWVNVSWVYVAMGICRMGICRLTENQLGRKVGHLKIRFSEEIDTPGHWYEECFAQQQIPLLKVQILS